MTISYQDFNLQNIDMMFAISQQELNQGLAEYLSGLSAQVSWSYDVDDNGNLLPPADPKNPTIFFRGTLAPPPVVNGAPACWILDLSQAGAANQVCFNLTFRDGASYTNKQTGKTYVQSTGSGGSPWIIPFQVDLIKAALERQANMPQWLRDRLSILNKQYGDVFDLSQILLDLQSLALTAQSMLRHPSGINPLDWAYLVQGMNQFLGSKEGDVFTQPPAVGYAATHNGNTPAAPLPTFMPTDADFVLVPNTATPGASALVFVLMINNNAMPKAPANEFSNTCLIDDPATTPGVALIRTDHFASFLQSELQASALPTAISQYVQTFRGDGDVTWQLAQAQSLASVSLFEPSNDNNGQVLGLTMQRQNSSDVMSVAGVGTYSGTSQTDSSASVNYSSYQTAGKYNEITVSGTLSTKVSHTMTTSHGMFPSSSTWTSPMLNFAWSASYLIQPVNDSGNGGGRVQFVYQPAQSNFPSQPTTTDSGDSTGVVPPTVDMLVNNLLSRVTSELSDTFEKGIVQSIENLGTFVFPAGGTFAFRDAAINQAFALYTIIQYQNPN